MRTILKLLLILLLLGATVATNFGLIDIRMDEIRYLLGNIASEQDVSNTFGIIAKYELIKRRMIYGEENVDNYELEAKIQALTSGDQLQEQKSDWKTKAYRAPVNGLLNGIRFLLGKKIISPKEDDKILSVLEIAYFWERNRKYNEAIKVYDDVLKKSAGLSPELKSAVMVHKAFSVSMQGEYDKAKNIYEEVINNYPTTEAGVLAWKLLDFIESVEKDRANVENAQMTEFEKAKQFYLLMDFRNSIKNFSLFLATRPKPEIDAEARFYKGRSHEELGETEEAVAEYRYIIHNDPSKIWAKQANRRMLMLGEFYEQQKQIADEAKKQLAAYQDQVFMKNVEQYAGMVKSSSLRGELMKDNKQTVKRNSTADSLLNLINNIGDLDLSGEKEMAKRQKELEKAQEELIASGQLSAVEVKELQRRQNLAQNPFRRPSILKKVIDENSVELKYIYNKRLRSGTTLSGKMLVEIHIKPDGSIKETRIISSNLGDPEFEKQVQDKIKDWHFMPIADSLGELMVNYPFEFTEDKE